MIAKNLTELIGNTPMLELNNYAAEKNIKANIVAKLEYFNPLGSVKDRIAYAMIKAAEDDGLINPGSVIIEPTSGNTGIGLAFIAAAKGYKLILTMPESMSLERRSLLKALGAQLVLTPASEGMNGAINKAQELAGTMDNSFVPQQFTNKANPQIHRDTTAKEIWSDLGKTADFFVAGVGTGGTITGVGEVLHKLNPNIKVVAVEPVNSAVLSGEGPGQAQDSRHRRRLHSRCDERVGHRRGSQGNRRRRVANRARPLRNRRPNRWHIFGRSSSRCSADCKQTREQRQNDCGDSPRHGRKIHFNAAV